MIGKVVKLLLFTVVAVIAVVLGKTALLKSRQVAGLQIERVAIPQDVAEHLAQAIRIRTITYEDSEQSEPEEFLKFRSFLRETFPALEREAAPQDINKYSVLYTWKGSDPSLKPYLLMAHLDVVPAEKATENEWTHPPFAGVIADGFVWGRGAVDNKANVVGILEGAELLAETGFQPRRTVYLAFGHDEEADGLEGALKIAEKLKSENVELEFVTDEGLFILRGSMPGVSGPVAYVGIAEKGYVDLELSVDSEPGHSSIPPRMTSVGRLSKAIDRLSENPFPAKIEGAVGQMFSYVAPEMSFALKAVFANRWLFKPVIMAQLAADPTTDAMIRTSTAPTMLKGSDKPNVLPSRPSAVVNFRILPGETIDTVIEEVNRKIDDPSVTVRARPGANNPLAPSSIDSPEFITLERLVRGMFPDVIVAPSMMLGGTDSKHFVGVAKNIYRFSPMVMTDEDLHSFHGINEKIGVDNFRDLVLYYYNLIKQMDAAGK